MDDILGCLGTVVAVIVVFIIWYPLMYYLGWISGWLIELMIGNSIVNGVGLLGIEITADQLPTICGVLNVIASFFRSSSSKE